MLEQPNFSNPQYLKDDQYKTSTNLSARIRLHQLYSVAPASLPTDMFNYILEHAPEDARILGLGSGRGDLWKDNAHRIPEKWSITLTDISEGMLRDNRAHVGEAVANRVDYKVFDAKDIPFEDNQFDIVIANYMLYHLEDRPRTLSEIRRVLKPTGTLFAATNGKNHMKRLYVLAGEIQDNEDFHSIVSDKFSLQNGVEQLLPFFPDIRMLRFQNDLWVTDAQAIIDYIASMIGIDGIAVLEAREDEIRQNLNRLIAADGGILIGKETGMFIANGFNKSLNPSNN